MCNACQYNRNEPCTCTQEALREQARAVGMQKEQAAVRFANALAAYEKAAEELKEARKALGTYVP